MENLEIWNTFSFTMKNKSKTFNKLEPMCDEAYQLEALRLLSLTNLPKTTNRQILAQNGICQPRWSQHYHCYHCKVPVNIDGYSTGKNHWTCKKKINIPHDEQYANIEEFMLLANQVLTLREYMATERSFDYADEFTSNYYCEPIRLSEMMFEKKIEMELTILFYPNILPGYRKNFIERNINKFEKQLKWIYTYGFINDQILELD